MAPAREGAKVNALPVLAVVFLPLIIEVEAPQLAAYALFAPSKPVIPTEHAGIGAGAMINITLMCGKCKFQS